MGGTGNVLGAADDTSKPSRADLLAEARRLKWFHSMDFGDYISPSRQPLQRGVVPNGSLQPIWEFLRYIDVTGLDCLDIGTADGIVAFTLKREGAKRVVATDLMPRRTFEVARGLLGLDVEYRTDVSDLTLRDSFEPESADVIVMAGLLYHLFSPLEAIAACRRILRPGGLLLIESCYTGGTAPAAFLNTEMEPPLTEEPSTYWVCTPPAFAGMLKLSGFDVLASCSLGNLRTAGGIGRIGYVARAVATSDISGRSRQLTRTHSSVKIGPSVKFDAMASERDRIGYAGPAGHTAVQLNRHPGWISLSPKPATGWGIFAN